MFLTQVYGLAPPRCTLLHQMNHGMPMVSCITNFNSPSLDANWGGFGGLCVVHFSSQAVRKAKKWNCISHIVVALSGMHVVSIHMQQRDDS